MSNNSTAVHYLYRILLPDGRRYIGVSKQPKYRMAAHYRAPTYIGAAMRLYGRNACRLEILCGGPRDYIYELEERAIKKFNTRYPAGCNRDSGGRVPERLPESIALNVASNDRTSLRKRAEFREETGVSQAQYLNYGRRKSRRPRKKLMAGDLPDLDNRTARESDPTRPWQILSRRYIAPNRTWASLAPGVPLNDDRRPRLPEHRGDIRPTTSRDVTTLGQIGSDPANGLRPAIWIAAQLPRQGD
jgi:hypothetical protein